MSLVKSLWIRRTLTARMSVQCPLVSVTSAAQVHLMTSLLASLHASSRANPASLRPHQQSLRLLNSNLALLLSPRQQQWEVQTAEGREEGREEEEEEEEEGLFRADAVNEEDPERDRATQV